VASAQSNLGFMYGKGLGVPQDLAMACAWFNVAATSGNENARTRRDRIQKVMTTSQIEKGQSLATEIFDRIQKRKEAAEAE